MALHNPSHFARVLFLTSRSLPPPSLFRRGWFSGGREIPNPIVPTPELLEQRKNLTVQLGQKFRENKLDEVIKIYQTMQPDDIKIARSRALTTIMNSYAKSKRFSEAIASFDHIFTYRKVNKDDINSFCIGIISCAETNKLSKAKQYYDKIKPIDREGKAAITMTEACLKMKKFEDARSYFQELINQGKRPTQRIFNSLIHSHIRGEQPHEALQFFDQMQKMGLSGDAFTYASLMNACNRAERPDKALWFFEEMSQRGIAADQMVYSSLLTACLRANRPDEAIKYFEEMIEHFESEVNCKILNPMLLAYSKERGLMEAIKFGEEMIFSKEIIPDTSTLNTMLSLYFKASAFDKAFYLFEELKEKGVQPDIITYTCLLKGCVANSDGKFEEFFQEMTKRGLKPNQRTYNILIHACAQKNDIKKALKILKIMEEEGSSDLFTYNSVLNVCKRMGDPVRAKHFYHELIRRNLTPDIVTFTSLLSAATTRNTNSDNNDDNSNSDGNNNDDIDSLTIPFVLSEMRKWKVQGNSHFCKILEKSLRKGGYPQTLTEFMSQHAVEMPQRKREQQNNNKKSGGR